MIVKRRYWIGTEGPLLQTVDTEDPIAPFRFESLDDAISRTAGRRGSGGVSVRRGETGREETPITSRRVNRRTGVTELDPISSDEYSAYRAAHFNAFGSQL